MYKNKIILFVIMALLLTGCTKINSNLDSVIDATMTKEVKNVNTVSTGYKLYIPMGVIQLVDNEYNQKFKIRDTYVYLYVDTISYYYKNKLNYKSNNNYNYYYRDINFNNKIGYVGINKLTDGSFFVSIFYNYSKIEFYANEEDLNVIVANSLIIINSIEYNDNLIKLELADIGADEREIKYELDKPDDSASTFSQYLQDYVELVDEKVILPDEE